MKGERIINRAKNLFSVSIVVVWNRNSSVGKVSSLQTAKLKGHLSILGGNRSSASTKRLDGLRVSPSTSVGTKGSCFGGKGA